MSRDPKWPLGQDGRLRVFRYATMKMVRAYDESMEMFTAAQSDPNMGDLHLDRPRMLKYGWEPKGNAIET